MPWALTQARTLMPHILKCTEGMRGAGKAKGKKGLKLSVWIAERLFAGFPARCRRFHHSYSSSHHSHNNDCGCQAYHIPFVGTTRLLLLVLRPYLTIVIKVQSARLKFCYGQRSHLSACGDAHVVVLTRVHFGCSTGSVVLAETRLLGSVSAIPYKLPIR